MSTTTNGYVDLTGTTVSSNTADRKSPTGSILCPEATSSVPIRVDITFHGVNASGGGTFVSLSD